MAAIPPKNSLEESGQELNGRKKGKPNRRFRLRRLALKELRETLRDRRTIVTLILMPLLVYPILSLVFRTFLTSNSHLFNGGEPVQLQIAFGGDGTEEEANQLLSRIAFVVGRLESGRHNQISPDQSDVDDSAELESPESGVTTQADSSERGSRFNDFLPFDKHRWFFVPPVTSDGESDAKSLEQIVQDQQADVGVLIETADANTWNVGKIRLISRSDGNSRMAARYLQTKIEAFNQAAVKQLLSQARLPTQPAIAVIDQPIVTLDGQTADEEGAFSLASLIPLILVLMTITGAVYPAIDLTAGEKERGTLETLMAAPIPRIAILASKFVAVWTVAVLTALLNMIGMAATVWAFQLDQFLTGSSEFTLLVMFKIFLLLVLFAAFFSALLLAVTSYARSFKEAQAYLIPIILLSMGPGLLAMTPGLSLAGPWAVTPMVNILLLARDVIQGHVQFLPMLIAIISTLFYAGLAIVVAARSFGSDAILYQTHGSFGEMFSRPRVSSSFVPLSAVVFCVVLLFPLNFVLIGILGRMPSENSSDLAIRFSLMGVFTAFSFLLLPWLVAKFQKARTATAFGLKGSRLVFFLAALLLGISLWPLVMSLVSGWHEVYGWLVGVETSNAWHEKLVSETTAQVARVRMVSPVLIALCLAVIPAACEEWFFRGMLLRSLLRSRSMWESIVISAVVFGLFHVLSNSVIAVDRMLPTMLVGLVLGYLAYKSDSILPGILLHALHNAAVTFLAYYQPQLSKLSWFPGEDEGVPTSWLVVACGVAMMGAVLVWRGKRPTAAVSRASNQIPPA